MSAQKKYSNSTIRSVPALADAGLVPAEHDQTLEAIAKRYAIAITPEMSALIDPDNPNDPIARQFVPDVRELATHPAEIADPIADHAHSPVPGLVHRHRDRVLLKIVGVCPVYCRFCFRREMVGPHAGHTLKAEELGAALDYIRAHAEVSEVILTGGDPFLLSPQRVMRLTQMLNAMTHVRVLRWHTRVPVVAPQLVTTDFIAALRSFHATTVVALHVNHPRELTHDARTAIAQLANVGIPLLSQTVLLSGINDDSGTLETLMRALVSCRVKPYYLHHADLAPGTAHFRVPIARGMDLMRELNRRLPGYARPDYVLDLPGGYGKVSLLSHAVQRTPDGYRITDAHGRTHLYRDALSDPELQGRSGN